METSFFVCSKGRSGNVPFMLSNFPSKLLHWIVPDGEEEVYRKAGAISVFTQGGGLCAQRNRALALGKEFGTWVFQMDDDLKSAKQLVGVNKAISISLEQAADLIVSRAKEQWPSHSLFGIAPTDNAFYGSLKPRENVFCIASFMLYKGGRGQFDATTILKEDYDFTCQAFSNGEGVVRFDDLLLTIQHFKNEGGLTPYRNPQTEKACVDRLKQKWPGWFRDNPKRSNEVLLKLPKIKYENL